MVPNHGRRGVTKRAILAGCLSTTMLFGWQGAAFAQEAEAAPEAAVERDAEPVNAEPVGAEGVGPDGEPRRGWWQRTFGN